MTCQEGRGPSSVKHSSIIGWPLQKQYFLQWGGASRKREKRGQRETRKKIGTGAILIFFGEMRDPKKEKTVKSRVNFDKGYIQRKRKKPKRFTDPSLKGGKDLERTPKTSGEVL